MAAGSRRSDTSIGPLPWHGGAEELQRLVETFSGLQVTAKEELLVAQSKSGADRRAAFEQRMDRAAALFEKDLVGHDKERLASLLKEDRGSEYQSSMDTIDLEAMDPKLEVTYKEFNTKDSGSPDDVMHRLHVKQVLQVSMEFGRMYTDRGVGVRVTLEDAGAKASVVGDEMFVNAAISRFKELFRQQRPATWWLRSPWFLIPFAAATTLYFVTWLVGWLNPGHPEGATWWASMVGIMCFYAQWFGIRWLVPSFELIPTGRKSKSQWALGVVGALVLSLVASGLYSWLVPPAT